MKVLSITEKYVTPKTTGYASAGGLGLAVLSGLSGNKAIRKTHKPLSCITAILTLLHIGLIEYYSYKYRRNNSKVLYSLSSGESKNYNLSDFNHES